MTTFQEIIGTEKAMFAFDADPFKRYPVGFVNPSPCMEACPAGVNVKSYISLIAAGKFHAALQVVRERNPLPGICGRICTHACETFCNRNEIDEPVAIRQLKRFVADYEIEHPLPKPVRTTPDRKEKVAIIGSGPAGLTAAHDLALKGYNVTVFEAMSEPGGMLIAGIPSYRLPRNILKVEIDYIRNIGVKIKTNTRISGKNGLQSLQMKYDAIFIAVGANKGKKLNIPGEDKYEGFWDALTFLRSVNRGYNIQLDDRIIVIGGGNVALDVARTAIRQEPVQEVASNITEAFDVAKTAVRFGAREVHLVCLESLAEMPASEDEIEEALEENIQLHTSLGPNRIMGRNGHVIGLETVDCLSVFDENGRFNPKFAKDSEKFMEAGTVIMAIGQVPDLDFLQPSDGIEISPRNTIKVDGETLTTSIPGIFAGGDAVSGPNTVIDAIAQGHLASRSIERYLDGKHLKPNSNFQAQAEAEIKIDPASRLKIKRMKISMLKVPERKNNFEEVGLGFNESTAVTEAQRCLRCGPCSECFICVPECDKEITLLSSFDGRTEFLFRLPPGINVSEASIGIQNAKGVPIDLKSPLKLNPIIPWVNVELCRSCGDCVKVCDYGAPTLIQKKNGIGVSFIDKDLCRGCGTCVAVCSPGAIIPRYFTGDRLFEKLDTINPGKINIVVFTCNWNGFRMGETELPEFTSKDTHIIFINFMCTGRIEPSFIFRALKLGADGVLICGCGTENCHYDFGARQAERTVEITQQMTNLLGIPSYRVAYYPLKGSDPVTFIKIVTNYIREVKQKTTNLQEPLEKSLA